MTSVLLPPVPYDRTSVRPAWDDLPLSLRRALTARLGARVVGAKVTATGFTSGFAALLETAGGRRHFIKAADLSAPAAKWYRREAEFTSALPLGVPAARLHWAEDLADHFVLCLDAIDGARTPSLPWLPHELDAALHSLAIAAAALSDPPAGLVALAPEPWGDVIDDSLSHWRQTGPEKLARLEARFDERTRGCTTLMHCDLRLDNIVLDGTGKAWICDWNHLCFGPPWFDTMTLLLTAEASGLDVDALFTTHPTAVGIAGDALDAALAAMAGFYLASGALPEVENSPALRGHQRYYGALALRWLSRRQHWPPPDPR